LHFVSAEFHNSCILLFLRLQASYRVFEGSLMRQNWRRDFQASRRFAAATWIPRALSLMSSNSCSGTAQACPWAWFLWVVRFSLMHS